ncbi:MAG: hypothetical protein ACOC0U_04870, partial [Desulfovibrionales bacterium]
VQKDREAPSGVVLAGAYLRGVDDVLWEAARSLNLKKSAGVIPEHFLGNLQGAGGLFRLAAALFGLQEDGIVGADLQFALPQEVRPSEFYSKPLQDLSRMVTCTVSPGGGAAAVSLRRKE